MAQREDAVLHLKRQSPKPYRQLTQFCQLLWVQHLPWLLLLLLAHLLDLCGWGGWGNRGGC